MLRIALLLLTLTHTLGLTPAAGIPSTAVPPQPGVIRVCTNKACRKDGSQDTLMLMRLLASTAAPSGSGAAQQAAFAAERVVTSGCLGQCGKGPNVALCDGAIEQCELFSDVCKPRSAQALLGESGVSVPDEAAGAALKRAYAMRALRERRSGEARDLCTAALNQAGALRLGAAHMLSELLELRADICDDLGERDAAAADRAQVEQLRAAVPQQLA